MANRVGASRVKPALRYHGAKWMLAPWIISNFAKHEVYTECFGGSAAVLLRKPSSYAEIYNDKNGMIVNLFRVLRDPEAAAELQRAVTLTPFSRVEFYGAVDCLELSPVERARRLLVRSYQGFGSNSCTTSSGFRSNSNRSGSTPAKDWSRWPDRVPALVERLRGVIIEERTYQEVCAAHDAPSTLHYADPPYLPKTRTARHGYAEDMTEADHIELSEFMRSLKGMVVLSGYPSELYESLFSDWHRVEKSALADGARKRTEVLWLNAAAHDNLNAGRLL